MASPSIGDDVSFNAVKPRGLMSRLVRRARSETAGDRLHVFVKELDVVIFRSTIPRPSCNDTRRASTHRINDLRPVTPETYTSTLRAAAHRALERKRFTPSRRDRSMNPPSRSRGVRSTIETEYPMPFETARQPNRRSHRIWSCSYRDHFTEHRTVSHCRFRTRDSDRERRHQPTGGRRSWDV